MTVPTNFNTWDRIVREAMREAGKLQDGQDPTSEQYARYFPRVQDMVNLWQTKGIKLWLWVDQSITLISGQATYTIKSGGDVNLPRPVDLVSGYYSDSNGVRRPLTSLSWDEYDRLSQVSQTGALNSYFLDKQALQFNLSFWLTPDAQAATGTAHMIVKQTVTGPVALNDVIGFPQEWFIALYWGLADEICGGQPQAIMDRCQARAATYLTLLEDFDVESTSTFFTPDARAGASGFR